ncbi:U3 small nucleolar RNA-associated protein 18 homolog isoform X2 [Phymastichus coffea]|uniref:U3 small nucleolar RNA-associated protein 18 homolog isoform X2 n=1 Tax=Phymastichus coffea TaxID=108790 RepID=UPI00273B7F67|nr:U3 small nucleolar RNA-associated protein 18 homolog isoform X2 [Phymastichus coffea]
MDESAKMGKKKVKQHEQQQFSRPTRSTSRKKRERTDSETSNDTVDKDPASTMPRETSSRRKKKANYDPEEEARLERLVFGDPSDILKNLKDDSNAEQETKSVQEEDDKDTHVQSDDESVITVDTKVSTKTPVWKDEDDEQLTVVDALKEQHRRLPGQRPETKYKELLQNKLAHIMGTPKWARLDKQDQDESDESDHEILKHSSHVVPKKSKVLSKGTIDLKVMADINKQTHIEGPFINVVQFHETSTVAMVAGSSGILSLFEVDGRENNKLHTIQFERFPIHSARFLREGNEIVVGSMSYAHCHSYDLITGKTLRVPLPDGITNMKKCEVSPDGKVIAICGRLGEVHLLYSRTKELIGTLKMNKKCRSLAFTPDSTKLITHGESSEVYVWDVQSRQCVNRAFDDGCLSACAVAISPNGQFIATGSKQGAVNIYESKSIFNEQTPQPVKTVLNLVTAITRLKFNPTTEILAMASDRKANAFRIVHLPSFNVFANFPTFKTKMFNPLDIDFSPASGYMSVSNNKGSAYLYRLKHYGNY